MIPVSIVIITLNEEKNIERCLRSVVGITDDIIVVDSYSTDKTRYICSLFNIRFYDRAWEGYSKTKNYANSLAKYDYVLSIDADEEVSHKLKRTLLKTKFNRPNRAYKFNRLSNYCGKWIRHSGWYPDTKLRIWNKNEGEWQGEVHEKIVFKKEPKITFLRGDLNHYTYYSVEDHLERIEKYSEIIF